MRELRARNLDHDKKVSARTEATQDVHIKYHDERSPNVIATFTIILKNCHGILAKGWPSPHHMYTTSLIIVSIIIFVMTDNHDYHHG